MKLSRKEFLLGTMGAVVVGGLASACGGDGGPNGNDAGNNGGNDAGNDASCLDNGTEASIGANHGHTLTVSKEDVAAGVEKTYDIQGSSPHSHTVTLTTADFATLAGNAPVTVTSSSSGHTHSVTVSCV